MVTETQIECYGLCDSIIKYKPINNLSTMTAWMAMVYDAHHMNRSSTANSTNGKNREKENGGAPRVSRAMRLRSETIRA
jgi:hypothetical protein